MSPKLIEGAYTQLLRDPHLGSLVRLVGKAQIGNRRDVFHSLCRSIIYQQLSGKAAGSIHTRFCALFPKKIPKAKKLLRIQTEKLRVAGLSNQKVIYLRDLAEKYLEGVIDPKRFPKMSDEEIITHLVAVKGIGVWTVHMFLIFTLGRPDVLPTGDLGVRKGFQRVFGMRQLPKPARMEKLAKAWRPYRSIASWYLWKAVDGGGI